MITDEITTIDQEVLVEQNVDWDILETHDELYEIMEQEPNPDTDKRWWSARKFAEKMEMSSWQRFEGLIESAKEQVHPHFGDIEGHFNTYVKTSLDRIGKRVTVNDYRLSLYAIYLILMITRKDTEFIKKAKANFSILTEIGKVAVEAKTMQQLRTEEDLKRLSISRLSVTDVSNDATDAIQLALDLPMGINTMSNGKNPYMQYRIMIKLLMTGMYPYQIKQVLGESLKIPTQDLMDGELLKCEILMHDRIAKEIRKATRRSKRKARKDGIQWSGMDWNNVEEIIFDVGKQAIDDCFLPGEIEQHLMGSDVGIQLKEAKRMAMEIIAPEETEKLESI